MNETDHRIGDQVQRCTPIVSDYRVRQMRDRGLRAIHMVCEQADNKADVVPCDRLPMNTSELWDALGSLPEEEMVQVITRLFARYEARLQQSPADQEALLFFRNLNLAITETCQCNSNRR